VTNRDLAQSYVAKIRIRLKALAVLRDEGAHSDVVREAQEIVELALKGALPAAGIEPPKHHDVGGLLTEYAAKLPGVTTEEVARAAAISTRLRKERELVFHGDIDFIPTDQYVAADAAAAFADAEWVAALANRVVRALRP
jgi:HEPN domain-containing protein